jgi:hypothetical protein
MRACVLLLSVSLVATAALTPAMHTQGSGHVRVSDPLVSDQPARVQAPAGSCFAPQTLWLLRVATFSRELPGSARTLAALARQDAFTPSPAPPTVVLRL